MALSAQLKYPLILSIFLCSCLASYGQVEYNKIKKQAERWYSLAVADEFTPKGAKNKTVDYPQLNYSITGYFTKGILTEGQIVEIYNTESNPVLLLRGKVSYLANRLLVKGVKYDFSEQGKCSTYGSFFVSNTSDNLMIFKPKKAKTISIKDYEIEYYLGYYRNNPAAIKIKDSPSIAIEGKGDKYSYNDLSAPLDEATIKRFGYDKVYDLLFTLSKNVKMHWDNGFYKDFNGDVYATKGEEDQILYVFLTGEKTGFDSGAKTIRVYENLGKLYMELKDNPEGQLKKETIVVADKKAIDKESYWNLRSFLENMSEIRWEYKNGDTFIGNATFTATPSQDGEGESIAETITIGKYTYSNGDYFVGDMSKNFTCGFPTTGTTYFKDGTKAEGNWLSEYRFTENQWAKLSSFRFPTEARDQAIEFKNDQLYNKYMTDAENAKQGKLYEEAKSYYLAAKEIKPDAEKWDDIIKELDKNVRIEARRKKMIAKYGYTNGSKIAEGIVELGMTKDMVIDALSTDDVLLHAYRVSNSTDWSNNRIETWEYDYDMAKRYMDNEMGDYAASINALMGLASAFGYNLRAEVSKIVKYKYLRFKNGKLIDLKDRSFYDDIDNATDNLNNSLWLLNGLF